MARPLRIDYPGARHHVMNRGARRAPIFVDDASCALFLSVVSELPERFDVRVHAYALMPNHYHLLLETPRGNLSRAIQHVAAAHVRVLNQHEQWDGPLYRGRFRNRVVETDAYWAHLLLYLHLNPVRAHLVADLDDSAWTSHAVYAGLSPRPEWLTTADLLAAHGGRDRYRQAARELHTGRRPAPAEFDPMALWRTNTTAARPEAADLAVPGDAPAELARIATVCAVEPASLLQSRPGRVDNRPRWVAAWWLTTRVGLTQRASARFLVVSEAQISRWIARVPTLAANDPQVAGWLEALEAGRPTRS